MKNFHRRQRSKILIPLNNPKKLCADDPDKENTQPVLSKHKRVRSERNLAIIKGLRDLSTKIQSRSREDYKSRRLFENFFILGSELELSRPQVLYQFRSDCKIPEEFLLEFSFPKGHAVKQLDKSDSGTAFYSLFYTEHQRDENSFVFSIPCPDRQGLFKSHGLLNDEQPLIYGCCVLHEDFKLTENTIQVFPRSYVLLSYIPCFALHFEVLYKFLSINKASRLKEIAATELDYSSMGSFTHISEDQCFVLDQYFNHGFYKTIKIRSVCPPEINYTFGEDISAIDLEWTCSVLFSTLTQDEIFQLVCAVLSEKNVMFVSENSGLLSSCVLGLLALVKPFKWMYQMHPVLPASYHHLLENPLPFIVGVSVIPQNMNLGAVTSCFLDKKLKINQQRTGGNYAYSLKQELNGPSKLIKEPICYYLNIEQRIAIKRKFYNLKKIWNDIIDMIPVFHDKFGSLEIECAKDCVLWNASRTDWDFISDLVNTQLFVQAIKDKNNY